MKLIFAGTPPFAAQALASLHEAGHEVALVLTQPDRPSGRGLKSESSAVKDYALKKGLPLEQPPTLKTPEILELIKKRQADVMVVAAYGLILPKEILQLPRLGCLNIHASLLPRWRGAAPIQRAILAGDTESGITIMQMDEGLDTGDMLLQKVLPITKEDTAGQLLEKLTLLGSQMIQEVLSKGLSTGIKQDNSQANYAAKILKEEALIDWKKPAIYIERQIRAFNPFPGAVTTLSGERIKIWRAHCETAHSTTPGSYQVTTNKQLQITCGENTLIIDELQRAGGRRLPTTQFLTGFNVSPEARFGT